MGTREEPSMSAHYERDPKTGLFKELSFQWHGKKDESFYCGLCGKKRLDRPEGREVKLKSFDVLETSFDSIAIFLHEHHLSRPSLSDWFMACLSMVGRTMALNESLCEQFGLSEATKVRVARNWLIALQHFLNAAQPDATDQEQSGVEQVKSWAVAHKLVHDLTDLMGQMTKSLDSSKRSLRDRLLDSAIKRLNSKIRSTVSAFDPVPACKDLPRLRDRRIRHHMGPEMTAHLELLRQAPPCPPVLLGAPKAPGSTAKPSKAQTKAAAGLRSLLASSPKGRADETTKRIGALLSRLKGLPEPCFPAQPCRSPKAFLAALRQWLDEAELEGAGVVELLVFAKSRLPLEKETKAADEKEDADEKEGADEKREVAAEEDAEGRCSSVEKTPVGEPSEPLAEEEDDWSQVQRWGRRAMSSLGSPSVPKRAQKPAPLFPFVPSQQQNKASRGENLQSKTGKPSIQKATSLCSNSTDSSRSSSSIPASPSPSVPATSSAPSIERQVSESSSSGSSSPSLQLPSTADESGATLRDSDKGPSAALARDARGRLELAAAEELWTRPACPVHRLARLAQRLRGQRLGEGE